MTEIIKKESFKIRIEIEFVSTLFYLETALFTSISYLTVIDRHDQKSAFARHIYFLSAANTTEVATDAHTVCVLQIDARISPFK